MPPFTGGWSPSPERYGGGEGNSEEPLVQRIFESLVAQRGSAYTSNPLSIVGAETMAYARAIAFDAWGANQRLANSFIPSRMTAATGMLQRWEKIFGVPPLPGDTELVRRARVAAAWAKIGQTNAIQPVVDALQAAIAPIYVGLVHQSSASGVSFVNGISNVVATGTAPPVVTFSGTPLDNFQIQVNVTSGGPLGASLFEWSYDGGRTFPITGAPTAASVSLGFGTPDTGVVVHFSSGTYATDNVYAVTVLPQILWTSTLAHLDVQVTYAGAGYHNTDGSPNAAFYALSANIPSILDEMLPSWATYSWFVNSSHGTMEFRLDEKNLDLEAFGPTDPHPFPVAIPGLAFRYRSDTGVAPGSTFTWSDISGNGHNATQGSATSPPTLVSSGGLHSLPYLQWGALTKLTATYSVVQPTEVFCVVTTSSAASNQYMLDSGVNVLIVRMLSGNGDVSVGGTEVVGSAVTQNAGTALDAQLNGASSSIALNGGTPVTGGSSSSDGSGTITIGGYGGGTGFGLQGAFYEIFAYSRILTAPERALVNTYLTGRYL
jgi:hypothetical protein